MMIGAFIAFSVVDVTHAYNATTKEMINLYLTSASVNLLFAASCFTQLSIMSLFERIDKLDTKQ
jgi:hypothetical protein